MKKKLTEPDDLSIVHFSPTHASILFCFILEEDDSNSTFWYLKLIYLLINNNNNNNPNPRKMMLLPAAHPSIGDPGGRRGSRDPSGNMLLLFHSLFTNSRIMRA